jgi:signal transduction histidine kinase
LANKRQKVKQLLERRALTDKLQQMENKMQLQQLEKKTEIERQRISISKDMHDEVSSGLASLRFFIGDMQRNAKQEEAKTLLGKAGEEALHVYLQAKEFMNRLNKGDNVEKYNVVDFLHNLSGTFGYGSSLEINTVVDVEAIEDNFTQTQHTETYRIIREAVANAMRHADASKMDIELYAADNEFHFSIRDNGMGLHSMDRGMGLSSMEERAKLLGGQLSFNSNENGTIVKGYFPMVA